MKTLLLTLLMMCTIGLYASKWDNKTASLKGKRMLVFTGYGKGFVHDNIDASAQMFVDMGSREGFRVDTTSSMSIFNDDALKKYDIIAFANASYLDFVQAQKDAFQKFIHSGGGFVGLHAATCTGNKWDWFTKMIGGCFDYHPARQQITVEVTDAAHPSTNVLPKPYRSEDELYIFKSMNPSIRVLAVHPYEGVDWGKRVQPQIFAEGFPAVWCNEFEGARIWYTSLGHNIADYSQPDYVAHVLEGVKWVANNKK